MRPQAQAAEDASGRRSDRHSPRDSYLHGVASAGFLRWQPAPKQEAVPGKRDKRMDGWMDGDG